MSAGTLYLVASGQDALFGKLAARAIESVRRPGKTGSPRVAASFAPMAGSKDGLLFMKKMTGNVFRGARVESFAVEGEPGAMDAEEARAVVDAADVIFIAGGDPVLGAKLLCAAGADAWLREANARGTPILGVSAGTILLGGYWAEWPDDAGEQDEKDEHGGAQLVRCLGVADDLVLDTHDEDDDWEELRAVKELVGARVPGKTLRYLGVPTGGALVVRGGDLETVGNAPLVLTR